MRKRRRPAGFSLVEILIVLSIAVVLFVKASQFFLGDLATSDLNTSRDLAVNFIQRARMTAQTRSAYVGLTFSSQRMVMYLDTDQDGLQDAGEATLGDLTYRGAVRIAETCGDNAIDSTTRNKLTFNSLGFVGTVSGATFAKDSWQLFLIHPSIDAGKRAREIEILSSGLIEKIPAGQSGYAAANARQANVGTSDCAAP